jgi:hypothetical protein
LRPTHPALAATPASHAAGADFGGHELALHIFAGSEDAIADLQIR